MCKLSLIIMFAAVSSIQLFAQKPSKEVPEDIPYDLEFEFTGETSTTLDSTFIVKCVVDTRKIKMYQKVILKSGTNPKLLKEKQINLSDGIRVRQKWGKTKIELGKAGEELSNIELILLKNSGDTVKLTKSNKKK